MHCKIGVKVIDPIGSPESFESLFFGSIISSSFYTNCMNAVWHIHEKHSLSCCNIVTCICTSFFLQCVNWGRCFSISFQRTSSFVHTLFALHFALSDITLDTWYRIVFVFWMCIAYILWYSAQWIEMPIAIIKMNSTIINNQEHKWSFGPPNSWKSQYLSYRFCRM